MLSEGSRSSCEAFTASTGPGGPSSPCAAPTAAEGVSGGDMLVNVFEAAAAFGVGDGVVDDPVGDLVDPGENRFVSVEDDDGFRSGTHGVVAHWISVTFRLR